MNRQEALPEIRQIAERILKESQEPVVSLRLLRDILHRSDDDTELVESRRLIADTDLSKRLEEELQEGMFIQVLKTAIDLGLPGDHPAFAEVKRYTESCLSEGILNASPRIDRSITGPDLSIFERVIASTLAKIDKKSPLVEEIFEKWLTIVGGAFSSGKYSEEDQIDVTKAIFSPDYDLRYTYNYTKAMLAGAAALLAARNDLVDPEIDYIYTRWYILEGKEILRTIERMLKPSCRPNHRSLFAAMTLLDMENLYGFRNWNTYMEPVADCFWKLRRDDGFWNFGSACANPVYINQMRLSDNWRGKRGAHDWTTRVLLLLQRYYENI